MYVLVFVTDSCSIDIVNGDNSSHHSSELDPSGASKFSSSFFSIAFKFESRKQQTNKKEIVKIAFPSPDT